MEERRKQQEYVRKNGHTKIRSESEKEYKDQEKGTNGKMNKKDGQNRAGG